MVISENQLRGASIILAVALVMYCAGSGLPRASSPVISTPYTEPTGGDTLIVELAGDTPGRGIYYLSGNPTVYDLLAAAEVNEKYCDVKADRTVNVHNGDTVSIHPKNVSNRRITIEKMGTGKRYVLDMPIDINRATMDDLMLIPGIGSATAQSLIRFRETKGRFNSINDLQKIQNLNGQRLDKVKRYFYVGKPKSY